MRRPDKYRTFDALARNTREDVDWRVTPRDRESSFLIAAIHGGRTEPHTAMIAKAIAGAKHSLYLFEAMIPRLHVASKRFNEPRLIALAHRHQTVLTVHGCRNCRSWTTDVFVGGLDRQLRDAVIGKLATIGFRTTIDRYTPGRHPDNICNAGAFAAGVQLEITNRLRKALSNPNRGPALRRKFVNAIRQALLTTCARSTMGYP
jgi:phage replication-related protein YjqB (UPF0714/DUF867 family)